jgi:hypothetical protein
MDRRLTQTSKTLAELIVLFPPEHLGDLLDLTVGALVSLGRAGQLGYKERIGKALSAKYYDKLNQLASGMAKGVLPDDRAWLAGYYFNSGLFRLGAAREITSKLLTSLDKKKATKRLNIASAKLDVVYEEYRSLKHDLRSIRIGRRVTYEQAVESLCELVRVLGERRAELSDSQTKFPKWPKKR